MCASKDSSNINTSSSSAESITNTNDTNLRFCRRTKIYLIPTVNEMTKDEHRSVYRSREDEQKSQQDLAKTIMLARHHNGRLPKEFEAHLTLRGVEHMASEESVKRRAARKRAILDAVLDEQDRQFDAFEAGETPSPIFDADTIALIAQQFSSACQCSAEIRGKQDESSALDN